MDVDGKNVFIGHSTLFKQSKSVTWPLTQIVGMTNEKGETKLVTLKAESKDGLLEELRDGCIRKFQIKKKKAMLKFTTQKGETIEDNDTLLNVLEQKQQITFKIS